MSKGGGMGPANPASVPDFVTASTPMGLRRLMLLNNIKLGSYINYFSIQNVNGKWFAWFYKEIDNQEMKKIITKD